MRNITPLPRGLLYMRRGTSALFVHVYVFHRLPCSGAVYTDPPLLLPLSSNTHPPLPVVCFPREGLVSLANFNKQVNKACGLPEQQTQQQRQHPGQQVKQGPNQM